ncbi:hypothetical protein D3C78_1662190 [compost metagenome]
MQDADAIAADILPYPLQNALTRPMRTEGGKAGNINVLSLWAGQAAPLARRESTADLVRRLAQELAAAQARH